MNVGGANIVHPTAIVGADVELGRGNVIGPYAVVLGPARVGDGNWIGPHVVLGTPAEIRGIDHGRAVAGGVGTVGGGLRIGDGNVIREYTTVHQGHYATTSVGDDCYLMNKVYIGHDGEIADAVTMAAGAALGGHVHVGAGANLGMAAIVHQRRIVGPGAMVGMGSVVTADIAPYALAYGNPCRVNGANRVGLARAGVDDDAIALLEHAYTDGLAVPSAPIELLAPAWAWGITQTSHPF